MGAEIAKGPAPRPEEGTIPSAETIADPALRQMEIRKTPMASLTCARLDTRLNVLSQRVNKGPTALK